MTDEARRENEACEAVVIEFRAMLAQNNIAEGILKLCDELSGRIQLRRLLDHASQRRGPDAERYARYTLQRALQQQT